ncbi:MAG: SRPBCC family protein [Phycisphaerae bacterium]|nr:SRPBCC family protein [Phycisphaerae bacterium]
MPSITITTRINAPAARVFDVLSDFAGAPQHISAIKRIEMLTSGPAGVGTRFKETRVMFGREASEVMEISQFDPQHGYELSFTSGGCTYRSQFQITPIAGNASDVTMSFDAQPQTFFAKVLGLLMRPMRGAMTRCITKDLSELKVAIERPVAA